MTGAIILAAGRSVRMGSPKALLAYRGLTFLESVIATSRSVSLSPIVAVLGVDRAKILQKCTLDGLLAVDNIVDGAGQIDSLKAGLLALNHTVDSVVVWPVDHPHVTRDTVERLLDRFQEERVGIVVPAVDGRRGHPILLARQVFPEIIEASVSGKTLRDVVWADDRRVATVSVQDLATIQDIDTPEDYAALTMKCK